MSETQPNTDPATPPTTEPSVTFDFSTWLAQQDEATRNGVTAYMTGEQTGLKKALDSERASAKELDKQLKAIGKNAEKGSELEKQVADLQAQLKRETQRKEFYATAPKELRDTEIALTVAETKGLIGDDGKVDWDGFKKAHPVLFAEPAPAPQINAGARGKADGALTLDQLVAQKRATGNYSRL